MAAWLELSIGLAGDHLEICIFVWKQNTGLFPSASSAAHPMQASNNEGKQRILADVVYRLGESLRYPLKSAACNSVMISVFFFQVTPTFN